MIAHDPVIAASASLWRETGVTAVPFDQLLQQADVVSLHIPLTPQTRNLLGAAQLATMKPGAVLINSARGGVIDETALAEALRGKRLGGAALDVFDAEPLKAGSPLAGCPNLVLTPHIAGVTAESNVRVSDMIADRVAQFLSRTT